MELEPTKILKTKMKNKEIDPVVIIACTSFIAEQDRKNLRLGSELTLFALTL